MRVSQTVKNIVAGISQQPPILRHMEQLEEQVNGFSTEADGLQKRPPTVLIKELPTYHMQDNVQPKVHFINRDSQEKYFVSFNGDTVQVYDLQGKEYTVKNNNHPYIKTNKPLEHIRTVTLADHTFIINRAIKTKMSDVVTQSNYSNGALIVVKSGQYGRNYDVIIDNQVVASHQTPDGGKPEHTKEIDLQHIVNKLIESINGHTLNGAGVYMIYDYKYVMIVNGKSLLDRRDAPLHMRNISGEWNDTQGNRSELKTVRIYPRDINGLKEIQTSEYKVKIEHLFTQTFNIYSAREGDTFKRDVVGNHVIFHGFVSTPLSQDELNKIGGVTQKTKYDITVGNGWFYIHNVYGKAVTARDGFNNQSITAITTEVHKFTDLPSTAPNGYIVKIRGEAHKDDDYYVQFNSHKNLWEETVAPFLKNNFDSNTLPHKLVRNADNTFSIEPIDWDSRNSGDEDSNPIPSFIGQSLNDVFFFRNRLGFIAGENVCLSRSGEYYNFWVDSATELVDSDPIDLGVSGTKISELHSAVPFNQDLFLFSDSTQFILHADGVLSPKNAYLSQVTSFRNDTWVRPEVSGRNIYFTAKRAEFTSIKEYYALSSDSALKDANDITNHVPNYIPNNVYDLISNSNENLLLALSTADKTKVYVYKYLFVNDSKVQASWSHWQFTGEILSLNFIDSTIYLLMNYHGLVCLERLDITFNTKDYQQEPYRLMLDRKEEIKLHGAYDRKTNTFTWNAKEHFKVRTDKIDFAYFVVLPDGTLYKGTENELVCNMVDDMNGLTAYVGIAYDYRVTLSELYIKHADQTGTTPMSDYRLVIQYLRLNYSNTGNLVVLVEETGKSPHRYHHTGRILGDKGYLVSSPSISTGEYKVPVHGANTATKISITNDSPLPSSIVGYTWEGNTTTRFRNI